jgi:hypothetical protein
MTEQHTRGRRIDGRWITRNTKGLTETDVAQIKRLALDGARTIDLAAQFGVSASMIRHIKAGVNWGWVQPTEQEDGGG